MYRYMQLQKYNMIMDQKQEENDLKSILLIGLGRFGRHVAEKLNELNDSTISNEEVNELLNKYTSSSTINSTNGTEIASYRTRRHLSHDYYYNFNSKMMPKTNSLRELRKKSTGINIIDSIKK